MGIALEFGIAIHPFRQPFRAEAFKPGVEQLAGLAKMLVAYFYVLFLFHDKWIID